MRDPGVDLIATAQGAAGRDFAEASVAVIDIFRATTSIGAALDGGARAVVTVAGLDEARALKRSDARAVLAGETYISEHLSQTLERDRRIRRSDGPLHSRLSDREYEVLCRIARGQTPTEIAEEMSLSVKTVSTYRTRTLQKMGMHSNAELMAYAMRSRLVR